MPPPHSSTQDPGTINDQHGMDVDMEEDRTGHENPQAMPAGPGPSAATAQLEDVDMDDNSEAVARESKVAVLI